MSRWPVVLALCSVGVSSACTAPTQVEVSRPADPVMRAADTTMMPPPPAPPPGPGPQTFAISSTINSNETDGPSGDTQAVFVLTAQGNVTTTLPVPLGDTNGGSCVYANWTLTNLTTGQQVMQRNASCTITQAGLNGLSTQFFATTTIGPFPPGSYMAEFRIETSYSVNPNGPPQPLAFGFGTGGFTVYPTQPIPGMPMPMPMP